MPLIVFAQDYPGLSSQQMQRMIQKAQEMRACMQNIDQTEMKALERQGQQMQAEVKKLCVAGKRDQALDKAIAFSQKVVKSSAMQEMKKCGDMMPELSQFAKDYSHDNSDGNICDNWK